MTREPCANTHQEKTVHAVPNRPNCNFRYLPPNAARSAYAEFSPDGQRIVTASYDKTARVWNAGSGQLVANLQGHTNYVVSAEVSPDGQRIVTASGDKTARVIRVVKPSEIADLLAK